MTGIDDRPASPPPVDALLLVSFGGPEGPADVLPFLENVTRGRNVPRERLEEVSRHYLEHFGGVSPINAQTRALKEAVETELAARGPELPVYWGNRNWHPMLADTLESMRRDGIQHALALVTSAFPSYSGCRQYREDVWTARGGQGPLVTKVRHYWAEDGFLDAVATGLREALPSSQATVLFTAHSIPTSMNATSGPDGGAYEHALRTASAEVVRRVDPALRWELVYQSRSGPPHIPWLEPDVGDRLAALHAEGVTEVTLVPIGFVSDHVEVLYDLDIEVQEQVKESLPGMTVTRAATVGTAPGFVAMLRDLVVERLESEAEQVDHGGICTHDRCPAGCCPPPAQRPR